MTVNAVCSTTQVKWPKIIIIIIIVVVVVVVVVVVGL
jgi:hypothetical protein